MWNDVPRIQNKDDLIKIQNDYHKTLDQYSYIVMVCSGGGCLSSESQVIKDTLVQALSDHHLSEQVLVLETGCMGTCHLGPVMLVLPDEVFYTHLRPEVINTLVISHFINDTLLLELTYYDANSKTHIPYLSQIDFFKQQVKIALRNCGQMDCNTLSAYIAREGYQALWACLTTQTPDSVVACMKASGLRGRGGGGFPTGIKWEAGLKAEASTKYMVCNADEGDPGAFMDRSMLEGDPHGIIEGILIGGYAIGASHGFVYVRAEYPLAIERLSHAITQARAGGLLGENIMGTDFSFDIEIRIGAGAFVCGEETALMNSIEGKRGEPRQKPPFPFQSGLFGHPTIINNVETFALVPSIILHGPEWFRSFGTKESPGTKVFALAGNIANTGIVEVPMGIPLGDLIFTIGGGIPRGKAFKAAQTGGPSGGCITAKNLNTPVDYDALKSLGTIMGSGGLISMDEDSCMVDMARFFMAFVQDESCGKCVPCRLGTKRMLEILERITKGHGLPGDIDLLLELGATIQATAVCGLGQTAPNPVLSMIQNFRSEYEDHLLRHHCQAGICSDLFISPCENACPAGVNVPGYIALIAAGRMEDAYRLIRKENPFPAVCGRVCTHPCESKCRRAQLDDPIAIADLKRYVADYVMHNDAPYRDLVFPKKEQKVGIIGAGPSGLTCAYYLARLGYHVDVYEMLPIAGGILAFGIPEYRLPSDILEQEIQSLLQVGFHLHLNTEVGKDIDFHDLQEKYHALYIATGTPLSNRISVAGEDLKGVYHGLDFLRDVHLKRSVTVGKRVVVIGGGNTAIDAARTALRLGSESVTILYRRTQMDMPADQREINDAIDEGVKLITLCAPHSFEGRDHVTGVVCTRMVLGPFDASGRRRPVPTDAAPFILEADMVIPAVSQSSDLPFVTKEEVTLTEFGTFVTDQDTLMTKLPGVFAGGDVARGSDVAITAIADGKKAAKAIDVFLGGQGNLNTGDPIDIPKAHVEQEIIPHERFTMKFLDPSQRTSNFNEVAVGFHRLNAIAESMRCLRCDRRESL
jgi:NADH-quinone oxidoreductase subunit F